MEAVSSLMTWSLTMYLDGGCCSLFCEEPRPKEYPLILDSSYDYREPKDPLGRTGAGSGSITM